LHGFIFFSFSGINVLMPRKLPMKQFEIKYKDIPRVQSKDPALIKRQTAEKYVKQIKSNMESERLLALARKRMEDTRKLLQESKQISQVNKPVMSKPVASKPEAKQEKKDVVPPAPNKGSGADIVIPPLPAGVEKMPAYLDYVQSVREKIKRIANSKYNRQRVSGDVLLNFVLHKDGYLSAVKIITERSSADLRLHDLAKQVIESASPFEAFPQDLEYKELSFSVVLSFE